MKLKAITGVLLSSALLVACKAEKAVEEAPLQLDTLEKQVSYLVGYDASRNHGRIEFAMDSAATAAGIEDQLAGKEMRISQEEMQTVMQEFQAYVMEKQKEIQAKEAEEAKLVADANAKEGEAFLAENGAKEGVTTLESGLQYKVLTEGTGAKPGATDRVTVHYRGTLIDGTEFDSSFGRGEPATFGVNQVIKGWTEALQLMPEGSRWELYIPSELAYGPGGNPPVIGPNSTLIFEVELLKAGEETEEAPSEDDGGSH